MRIAVLSLCLGGVAGPADAGAFLLPEGYGQFIAGIGFSEGSRRFDSAGHAEPTPAYRKLAASGYLEYGLVPWLSLVAAPTLARENGVAANTVTGSDSSAFGARLGLYTTQDQVISVQVLVQPPLAPGDRAAQLAVGGARNLAVDVRVMYGRSFLLFGKAAFIDIEPGAQVRADPFPTQARLDVTFGIRVKPRALILLQSFASLAPSAGPQIARTSYDKLQGSLVYDLTPALSAQIGAFRTVAGRNAIRETGPLGAIWYRF